MVILFTGANIQWQMTGFGQRLTGKSLNRISARAEKLYRKICNGQDTKPVLILQEDFHDFLFVARVRHPVQARRVLHRDFITTELPAPENTRRTAHAGFTKVEILRAPCPV